MVNNKAQVEIGMDNVEHFLDLADFVFIFVLLMLVYSSHRAANRSPRCGRQ